VSDSIRQFAHALRAEIRKDMNDLADGMATGHCPDFATYRHQCGVIQGLARAEAFLLDLAKKAEQSDDDPDS
jgi:hypothetical protein